MIKLPESTLNYLFVLLKYLLENCEVEKFPPLEFYCLEKLMEILTDKIKAMEARRDFQKK